MKKIDLYAHCTPQKFIDAFVKTEKGVSWKTNAGDAPIVGGPVLWDINKRLEVMERFEDYVQLLVPAGEVVESFFSPKDTAYLAQSFNDATADWVNKYPDKF